MIQRGSWIEGRRANGRVKFAGSDGGSVVDRER